MRHQRGVTLITALAMTVLFLIIAFIITALATGNSQTVGNVYQKQQYYDVAEAGIDRGLGDINSVLPSPGASGFLNATPSPPAPPSPGTTQTPLANIPGIGYTYGYWYNTGVVPTPTADPWAGSYNIASSHQVWIPSHSAVIWSKTTVGIRDVAVEAIVQRFSSSGGKCALCAGTNITVTGNPGAQGSPPAWCQGPGQPGIDKVCTDPSPNPTPTFVPIVAGGTYTTTGNCNNFSCSYGDGGGSSTPYPHIQSSASPATVAGFLAAGSTLSSFANNTLWQSIANGTSIRYLDCSSGCSASQITNLNLLAGQIAYLNGSLSLSSNTVAQYAGVLIAKCVTLSGHGTLQGNGFSAETIAWGTDSQCGGYAISTTGNSLWQGGLAYAAAGSAQICGTGTVKYSGFYGAVIAANGISLCGNGDFMWESGLTGLALNFGPWVVTGFAQY